MPASRQQWSSTSFPPYDRKPQNFKIFGGKEIRIGTIVPGNIIPIIVAILAMDLKEAMATNVRRARHARKLTQEELADRAGLSVRYLGSIERGTVSASVTVLGRLAQALRIDASELITVSHRRR
jgi:DNA-binding XRE family transcriptional regulator